MITVVVLCSDTRSVFRTREELHVTAVTAAAAVVPD